MGLPPVPSSQARRLAAGDRVTTLDFGPAGSTIWCVASGKLNLRLPKELHDKLVEEAAHQGVSLNMLIVAFLAGAVGWRKPE